MYQSIQFCPRRLWRVGMLAVAMLIALTACAGAARAANYVALGDSYAAGPLIPNQIAPLGCLKSDHNYAHLAAPTIGLSLKDATCSGATTEDMTESQSTSLGSVPPQFDSLSAETTRVSLTIGGNDIGFTEIIENCVTLNPFSTPCKNKYDSGGHDQIAERIAATAPKVAAVLQGIHARSPSAKVFVVNYAAILPETGYGCWPQMPLGFGDVPYLRAKEKELNTMLATQAGANGASVVNWYNASIGHDACKGSSTRWVEPLIPTDPAAPVHPNLAGMTGAAAVLGPAAK